MAVYKVPQDVEADDKLIGPFSFRQFIYLIIVALAGTAAWGLAQLSIILVVIPLPIILLFGVLALPLRKDQPMEIYLAAMIAFYLKPRKRLWDPDGIESLIEITAPRVVEVQRTKNLSENDALERFSYLADIVDTQGWAVRGVGAMPGSAMNTDVLLEAQGVTDILDTRNSVAQSFDSMMTKSTERVHEEAIERMRQATAVQAEQMLAPVETTIVEQPNPATQTFSPFNPPAPAPIPQNLYTPPIVAPPPVTPTPVFNPYPTEIQQASLQPITPTPIVTTPEITTGQPATAQTSTPEPTTTSDTVVSAGIMNLANNSEDLSIETIAHEAQRITQKEESDGEVLISLR